MHKIREKKLLDGERSENKEPAQGDDIRMRDTPVIWKSCKLYKWDLNIVVDSSLS